MKRRSSPRIKVKDLFTNLIKNRLFPSGKKELARIIDLGPKGMGIEIKKAVPMDTKFIFVIELPPQRKIRCEGVIKNSRKTEKGYIHGIEFTKLAKPDKEFLKNSANILKLTDVDYFDEATALADRLKLLRSILRMTPRELAEASGVDINIIFQLERGDIKDPPEALLKMLANTLGSTTDTLKSHPLFLSLFKAKE